MISLRTKTVMLCKLNISKSQGKVSRRLAFVHRARTFKCLWGSGIDSKEWIPPAYVAWRAGTITLFLLGSYPLALCTVQCASQVQMSWSKSIRKLKKISSRHFSSENQLKMSIIVEFICWFRNRWKNEQTFFVVKIIYRQKVNELYGFQPWNVFYWTWEIF